MSPLPDLAAIGALLGDQSRAVILAELMNGRALTATELAAAAGIAPPTASEHLARLVGGKLLTVEVQGRHRYFRIRSAEIADVLEALGTLAPRRPRTGDVVDGVRFARACYDHLAGLLAVRVRQRLLDQEFLVQDGVEHHLTPTGETLCASFGLDLERARSGRRSFARACLDWSERQPHIAGGLGAALLRRLLERRWLARCVGSRELELTAEGREGLAELLGLDCGPVYREP
ncbi:MAG TPA: helix-turn-helix transcriptional regulator [Chloroflexota bacterium]|nr:helix-turn-helix transcriptional regulator [Chloroflexota bacterium]